MPKQFYYQIMGEALGPVTGERLRQLALDGSVTPNTSIRIGEDGEWTSAFRLKNLFDASGKPISLPQPKSVVQSPQKAVESTNRTPALKTSPERIVPTGRTASEAQDAKIPKRTPPVLPASVSERTPAAYAPENPPREEVRKKRALLWGLVGFFVCLSVGALIAVALYAGRRATPEDQLRDLAVEMESKLADLSKENDHVEPSYHSGEYDVTETKSLVTPLRGTIILYEKVSPYKFYSRDYSSSAVCDHVIVAIVGSYGYQDDSWTCRSVELVIKSVGHYKSGSLQLYESAVSDGPGQPFVDIDNEPSYDVWSRRLLMSDKARAFSEVLKQFEK